MKYCTVHKHICTVVWKFLFLYTAVYCGIFCSRGLVNEHVAETSEYTELFIFYSLSNKSQPWITSFTLTFTHIGNLEQPINPINVSLDRERKERHPDRPGDQTWNLPVVRQPCKPLHWATLSSQIELYLLLLDRIFQALVFRLCFVKHV